MKHFFYFLLAGTIVLPVAAQAQVKLFTKTGTISFHSKTPIENIYAINNKGLSVWELSSGKIEFAVLMKGFEFEKALMQEHFNENYVESDQYPKATFKGTINNSNLVLLDADKSYNLTASGLLTLHGISKEVSTTVLIVVKNGKIRSSANFSILLADYKIKIPSLVADNINKRVDISVVVNAYQHL